MWMYKQSTEQLIEQQDRIVFPTDEAVLLASSMVLDSSSKSVPRKPWRGMHSSHGHHEH